MTIIHAKYSRSQAARLCGFKTVAMLDYLERSGVFVREGPKRRGKVRNYSFRDLLVLRVLATLLSNGASVASLKTALVEFQKTKWRADPSVLEDRDGGLRYIVASGPNLYFVAKSDALVDLSNRGQLAFSFIIDLDRLHKDLCETIGLPRHAELPLAS
jgi:DNA-binding transcriptional MerR regulator